MKIFVLFLWLVGLSFSSAATAAETAFLDGFEDLPLHKALEHMPEAGIVFDVPQGRIAEAYARAAGDLTPSEFFAFYEETLVQLGWQKGKKDSEKATFTREGENLRIEIIEVGSPMIVLFRIAPGHKEGNDR